MRERETKPKGGHPLIHTHTHNHSTYNAVIRGLIKAEELARAREIAKQIPPSVLRDVGLLRLIESVEAEKSGGGGGDPTPARPLEKHNLLDHVQKNLDSMPDLIHPTGGRLQQRRGAHILRFDGGARKNPGPAGAGIVICEVEDKELGLIGHDTVINTNS